MWLHKNEHDGFRVIARKHGTQVRLYSRPGKDLTYRFPLIAKPWLGCARDPASSMARQSAAAMMACRTLIASAIAGTTPACFCMPST